MTLAEDSRARSIPAWAGKPAVDVSLKVHTEVYPRVGGETILFGF